MITTTPTPTTADPSSTISDPPTASDDIDYDSLEEPRDNLYDKTEEYEDIDRDHLFFEGTNNDILQIFSFNDFLTNAEDSDIPFVGECDIDEDSVVDNFSMLVTIPLKTVTEHLLLMKKMSTGVLLVTFL